MTHIFTIVLAIYVTLPILHALRGDDNKLVYSGSTGYYSEVTCTYNNNYLKNTISKCTCPKIRSGIKSFQCICSDEREIDNTNTEEPYLCECDSKHGQVLSNCTCVSVKNQIDDLNCTLKHNDNDKPNILLGVLIPFTLGTAPMTSYASGTYYASAMFLAIDDVNNNKDLLPNHTLSLVWADTICDWKKTIQVQLDMIKDQNVDAFIGGGCAGCEAMAKNAGAVNIPIISHVRIF